MSLTALILLIVAAALHTGWNLLVKRAGEKQIFTWWAMVVGVACFAPLLAFSAPLPAAIWPYVLASALVETIYYLALLRAYTIGDFSLIYPLARGAAPAFLALWAALFLGERPHAGGMAGLALLLVGLLLVGGAARRAALREGSVALALGGIPTPALSGVEGEGGVPAATAALTDDAAATYIEYTVQKGDLLNSIAKRYNVTAKDILAINQISNADSLTVGQVIRIPKVSG